MRTLFYVPVIHSSADLGSIAKSADSYGTAKLGEEGWQEHLRIVRSFWNVLAQYFETFDASGLKIYQDGMLMDGEGGRLIVEENVKAGSKNYEVVLSLMKRGAVIVKTEDVPLVMAELNNIIAVTQKKTVIRKWFAYFKYMLVKNKLLNKRDEFIARRIVTTLNAGERGVIFIGAFHRIKNRLPRDIKVIEIKNIEAVREYQKTLLYSRRNKKKINELGNYLVSPLDAHR